MKKIALDERACGSYGPTLLCPLSSAPKFSSMLSTSSNALWGHILPLHARRDTSTAALPPSDASITRTSMQPVQDRNATSLRVLLNSAEMCLQKFSSRVDELVLGVGEAKAEVKHAGKLLDGVGDRVVGDVTTICKRHGVFSQWQLTTRVRAVNRMQGRVLEIVRDPAQQTTLLSLAAEHKAMSTKIDLMQLVRTISFPSSSSLCTIV